MRPWLAILLIAFCASPTRGQEIRLRADEVLLDVVATDSRGKPVLDLVADELQVFEEGQRQTIASVRLVRSGNATRSSSATSTSPVPEPDLADGGSGSRFNLILIVVDRTSTRPDAADSIINATRSFANEQLTSSDLVAVFMLGTQITLVENFTNDPSRIVGAVARAIGSGAGVVVAPDPKAPSAPSGIKPMPTDKAGPAARQAVTISVALQKELDRLAQAVGTTNDSYHSRFRARAFVYGLLSLLDVYGELPGRKSVLLLSSGVASDASLESHLASLIAFANQSNVAFYTVDAAGLRTVDAPIETPISPGASVLREERGDRTLVVGGTSGIGRNEARLRGDTSALLARLAEDTGGLWTRNTNDLGRSMGLLAQDLSSYYVVSYVPTVVARRTAFRSVEVKTTRKGIRIRGRSGYFAGAGDDPVLPYEQPLLAALVPGAPRRDLGLSVSSEAFAAGDDWLVPVFTALEGKGLEPISKGSDGSSTYEVGVVALLQGSDGAILSRQSRQAELTVPATAQKALDTSELALPALAEPFRLAPGDYVLLVGARDSASGRISIVEKSISLPPVPGRERPGLSTLMIGRGATASKARDVSDPLSLPGARVIPATNGMLDKTKDRLLVYFRFYGVPGSNCTANVEVTDQAGKVVLTSPDLPLVPDTTGEAIVARAFSLESFPPGAYTARVRVVGSSVDLSRTSGFRVR